MYVPRKGVLSLLIPATTNEFHNGFILPTLIITKCNYIQIILYPYPSSTHFTTAAVIYARIVGRDVRYKRLMN